MMVLMLLVGGLLAVVVGWWVVVVGIVFKTNARLSSSGRLGFAILIVTLAWPGGRGRERLSPAGGGAGVVGEAE